MNTLIIGDRFIPAEYYLEALRETCPRAFGPIRTLEWSGNKHEQHAAQQQMERGGPGAVPISAEIMDAMTDAEIVALHFAPLPAAILNAAVNLKAIVVARTGLENVDLVAARARGIEVSGIAGRNASAVAEMAIGLMLAEARDIARADRSIKSGGWRKAFAAPGQEISSSTVGLVGFGYVGQQLASKLRGFAPRLLVYSPSSNAETLARFGATPATLEQVFAESDFVSVQARLTQSNEQFIGASLFNLMKPHAYFLNVGRSRLVCNDDLYQILVEGRIGGAALDVHDEEPLPIDSRWRQLDNVTLTPHSAGDTLTTPRTSARLVAERLAELSQSWEHPAKSICQVGSNPSEPVAIQPNQY